MNMNITTSRYRSYPRRCRGSTLMEVLVSIFVLSVGVLGVAGLQITAKHSNFEATQRATATALAQDIVERMRANPDGISSYCNTACGSSAVVGGGLSTPNPDCDAAADGCTAANMAAVDLFQWEQQMLGQAEMRGTTATGGLVNPRACISGPAGGIAGMYTVLLVWRGSADSTPATIASTVCSNALNSSTLYGAGYVNRRQLTISVYVD